MLRKGRWDELFFVDLPNQSERDAIWTIQIAKYKRDPKDFDILQLAKATEGLTGSEIEALFIDSLFQAFGDDKEPTDLAIAQALTDFVPLSKPWPNRSLVCALGRKGRRGSQPHRWLRIS
jgi:SpoVK/Ycf46/Vps4 family AAA+-type ATPase